MTVFVHALRDDAPPHPSYLRRKSSGTASTATDLTGASLHSLSDLGSASAYLNLDCDDGPWGSIPSASRHPSLSSGRDFLRSKLRGGRDVEQVAPWEEEGSCVEEEEEEEEDPALHVGGDQTPKLESRKAPAPPRGAWVLYSYATRVQVLEANPEAPFQEISRIISCNFKALSPEERAVWDRRAEEDRQRYARELAEMEARDKKRGNGGAKKADMTMGEFIKQQSKGKSGARRSSGGRLDNAPPPRRARSVERFHGRRAKSVERFHPRSRDEVSVVSNVSSANSSGKRKDQTLGEIMKEKSSHRGPWYSATTYAAPAPAPAALPGVIRCDERPTRKGSSRTTSEEGSILSGGGGGKSTKAGGSKSGPWAVNSWMLAHPAPPVTEISTRPGRAEGRDRPRGGNEGSRRRSMSADRSADPSRRSHESSVSDESFEEFLNFISNTYEERATVVRTEVRREKEVQRAKEARREKVSAWRERGAADFADSIAKGDMTVKETMKRQKDMTAGGQRGQRGRAPGPRPRKTNDAAAVRREVMSNGDMTLGEMMKRTGARRRHI